LNHYFTIGSTNMDYRSMAMDGEALIILAGKQALIGSMDFLIIAGLCEWLETPEEIEELLPAPGRINRTVAGWMKLGL
jgi:phosphatidylserine/phosphatidylglycerophosphate/cardiolipin synthase-like enzyme